MSTALAFTYRYPFASGPVGGPARGPFTGLELAPFNPDPAHSPWFFQGFLAEPERVGKELIALVDLVRRRFDTPRFKAAMLDPVVTANDGVLRFEGFSSCGGVYARVDLTDEALQAEVHRRGTTNVDFNQPMRAALSRMRKGQRIGLAVGREGLELRPQDEGPVVEKKVKLPVRWVKGLCEVASYLPDQHQRFEVDGAQARSFFHSLPRTPRQGTGAPGFVVPTGRGLRSTTRQSSSAAPVAGTHRLQVLEPLLGRGTRLQAFSDGYSGVSTWIVHGATSRFTLVLSPDAYRGFSGEGQALADLADEEGEDAVARVQSALRWQRRLELQPLAEQTGLPESTLRAALARLVARGQVGFDVSEGAWFHRELPFGADRIEALNPRLKAARKLLEGGGVRWIEAGRVARVQGTEVEHHVRLDEEGDTCTCVWWARHRGARGPCRHVLAARMAR